MLRQDLILWHGLKMVTEELMQVSLKLCYLGLRSHCSVPGRQGVGLTELRHGKSQNVGDKDKEGDWGGAGCCRKGIGPYVMKFGLKIGVLSYMG